jgi:hypothetical protein
LGNSAYIKLVEGSSLEIIELDQVKEKLIRYIEMTTKTGKQLAWNYEGSAFPYSIIEKPEAQGKWFYLKGKDPKVYKHIMFGIGHEQVDTKEEEPKKRYYIQVVLPEGSTHGDKSKANEFCKFLAKEFKGQLHLFNERVMFFNPRK